MRFRLVPLLAAVVAATALAGATLATPALAADALSGVTITGAPGEKPIVAVTKPVSVKSSVAEVVSKGTGDTTRKGSTVTLDYVLVNGRTGDEVQTSYGQSVPPLSLDRTKTKPVIVDSLVGEAVGSRVMIAIAPKEGMAKQLASDSIKKNDTLLFIVDLHSTYGPFTRATGSAVAPVEGLPTVKLAKNGAPTVTMPKGTAPTTLVTQPLITGSGPAVQAGQTITVQYTGAIWDTGKVFDSSWKTGTAFTVPIGTKQVIAGWDTGLVGQTVGSQVLLVIPPDQGYGASGNGEIKGTDTLVFVVDILDANLIVTPAARVLVTGASGYVGGRLVPELLANGHPVRCAVREPRKLDAAPWRHDVEVLTADIGGDLDAAMHDVDVAVFLVHSIGEGADWVARERANAENFRRAAEAAGVRRIVYLGGLGADGPEFSDHLRSRHDVGRVLAAGPIEAVELRAAVVIGSGSASFEMLRYLTEVLPVMVTPKWVRTECQPISIRDVLRYLVAAIEHPAPLEGVLEIGGPDVVSYAEMMAIYAREAGLARRCLIPVPVLTPRLSSLWVGLVTPVPSQLARPLVDSLVTPVVVTDHRAEVLFPFERVPLAESIHRAIGRTAVGEVPTRFDDASSPVWQASATDPSWTGGTELTDVRAVDVAADPDCVWDVIVRVGGDRGWYGGGGELLWKARGWLDQVVGGPGLRRGRRHADRLAVGEPVDFWRVEDLDVGRRLVLHAEMRVPGEAWLEWMIEPTPIGTHVVQTARFRPRGLFGRAYWLAVLPFHRLVFPGLLDGIVRDAVDLATARAKRGSAGAPQEIKEALGGSLNGSTGV